MKIEAKHKSILLLACIGITIGAFFGLRLIYQTSSVKHCQYIHREVSDIGTPEKVCPRVCKRHGMEDDKAFSYLSQKLGSQCACCSDIQGGTDNTEP